MKKIANITINPPSVIARILFLMLIILIFTGADLGVKELVNQKLKFRNDLVIVPGFWHFRYETNDDIGFSLLKNVTSTMKTKSKWILLVILQGVGTILVIAFYLYSKFWKHLIPLALIVSGALGNVLDRIMRGFVIDYVMWYYKGWVWPIFNLADIYTVCGAGLLFIILFFFSKELSEPKQSVTNISDNSDTVFSDNDDTLDSSE